MDFLMGFYGVIDCLLMGDKGYMMQPTVTTEDSNGKLKENQSEAIITQKAKECKP